MTSAQLCANHRRLTRVGFRRHPDGTYFMPGHPSPRLQVNTALESIEDVIELAYAWGHEEGQREAKEKLWEALLR